MTNNNLCCAYCKKSFIPAISWQITCSKKCGYMHQNSKRKREITNFGLCLRCGISLQHKRAKAMYCSKSCKSMDHVFKHRSKTRIVGTARRNEIFLRDSQKCYMCLKKLGHKEFHLDHLVPVSRGGDNSENNLAVSCRYCNQSRGSRIGILQLSKLFELRR